ncbi:MAG: type II toxin-antitoxin system VapC family toxin [Acidimicrobiaceae bacterium]|nr:type II toxin-antitoxin system VapC family toxin [Acidimicrobiaceae bacterium]
MVFYLETSAAVKLIVREAETEAMLAWAQDHAGNIVSSDLTRTELLRAVRRGAPDRGDEAGRLLDRADVVDLPTGVFERAAVLDPAILRTLDALHLAAAMEFGADLEGMVTYDDRLASAAAAHGITVVSPGADQAH